MPNKIDRANSFSFDFSPANIKVRFANDKIIIVLKEENDHISIHFRDDFQLLDVHRKNQNTGEYQHLYVAKIEKLVSALTKIQPELHNLILKYIRPITYEELSKHNFWLQFNSYIYTENYFDKKSTLWLEFENDFIGRSVILPVQQMRNSITENIERTYQVFEDGETEPIGTLFQKATNLDKPLHFFISTQDVNNILKEGQKLVFHFSKLHDPEEQRKIEEEYE